MTESYCLICHKIMRQEGSFFEMFRIEDVICQSCRSQMLYHPKKIRIGQMAVSSLYVYQGLVRDLMIQYKEYRDEALFPLFLYKEKKRLESRYRGYVIVPMPSSIQSVRKRGFAPATQLFSMLDLPIEPVLYKSRDIDQKKLNYRQRQHIAAIIQARQLERIADRKVLLVDDIVTSGASLKAAYQLLQGHCARLEIQTICYNYRFLNSFERYGIKMVR